MKIDEMIKALFAMKEKVGGDAEVPVMTTFGENDYIIPSYPVVGELEDQDGNKFKCAFIGEVGGEELTEEDVPHYEWNPKKCKLEVHDYPVRFDGYLRIAEEDLHKFPPPTIVFPDEQESR